jgi:hypothetical protein
MPTPNPISFTPPRNIYQPGTPEWLYDEIMRFIEPDLMIESVPLLDATYADETPEQKQERQAAYAIAFQNFDRMLHTMREALGDDTMAVEVIRLNKKQQAMDAQHVAETSEKQAMDSVFNNM